MVLKLMTTAMHSTGISRPASAQSSNSRETKKYLLLRDTVAKYRPSGGGSRSRLLSKRSEQRVLKGSLWQEVEGYRMQPISPPPSIKSMNRSPSASAKSSGVPMFKQFVESIEIEDLTLQCASAILGEISPEICALLLAIPTSEERYYVYSDADRIYHARFINVGSDVIVSKRNVPPCRAMVKWKGRLAGKQGIWFGVEIMDEQSRGSGDSDGSVNNIRLFSCEKNNGMVVNIGQITLVPPKRPSRRPKKKAPSTPSLSSENNFLINGSQTSDQYTNDLVSQTESELSFMDDINSAETAPLVTLQVGDRVLWPADHGNEEATVRWIGTLPDEESLEGEILVGVEFDNPIGKGTGRYKNQRLFDSKRGHASLVPLDGLIRLTSTSNSLRNLSDTCSQNSLSHTMHEYNSPPAHMSAADVLASLAMDENTPELESSDHNNNSNRGSQIGKQDVPAEILHSPSPEHHSDRPNDSNFSEQSTELSSSFQPEPMVNGLVNVSTSSSDNLGRANNCNDDVDTYTRVPISQITDSNHLSSPRPAPESCSDTADNNGWSDSACSSSSEHIAVPKHTKPLSKHKITSYHVSKAYSSRSSQYSGRSSLSSRNKAKTKNGLVKLHSLDVKDMHDIADDLELNSSNDSLSVDHAAAKQQSDNSSLGSDSEEYDLDESHHKPYLLARLSNSPPPHNADVVPPPTHTSMADEHSTSILSPLMERTTPVSFSSLDNQTDSPSMMSSDITVIPASLAEGPDCDNVTLEAVPYAPPEFAGDTELPERVFKGFWKGIAASSNVDSGFIEAVLYLLSVSTDLLIAQDMVSSYPQLKKFLVENMTLPLRSGEFIEASVTTSWKTELDEISTGRMLTTDSSRELHKFITTLLQHIISIPPLYQLNNEQTGYVMNLSACKDARVGFPTVQKLLEKTCIRQKTKLIKVPEYLILIPSRSSSQEMIFPNLHIDLTDVLEYAKRICHMCGERAVFECPECYEHESAELSAAAFCEPCSQTVHRHSKRVNHMPVQLKGEQDEKEDDGSILLLKGILLMRDGQYTSLSEPPDQLSSTNAEWLHFNSKAHRQGTTTDAPEQYIPEVSGFDAAANWLTMDSYDQLARDINAIPAYVQRLLQDCFLCVYSKS